MWPREKGYCRICRTVPYFLEGSSGWKKGFQLPRSLDVCGLGQLSLPVFVV